MNDYEFDYESIDDVRKQIAKLCRAGVYDGLSNDNIRDASIALANAVQQINAFLWT